VGGELPCYASVPHRQLRALRPHQRHARGRRYVAQRAGAQIIAASDEDGVYSGYFTDPDGHTWEVLFDGE
jgi:hypothetical protein